MNQQKLKLELMRAILRSTRLKYEDVYPIINKIYFPIAEEIVKMENQVQRKNENAKHEKISG
jgi:hypothetical protein